MHTLTELQAAKTAVANEVLRMASWAECDPWPLLDDIAKLVQMERECCIQCEEEYGSIWRQPMTMEHMDYLDNTFTFEPRPGGSQ